MYALIIDISTFIFHLLKICHRINSQSSSIYTDSTSIYTENIYDEAKDGHSK